MGFRQRGRPVITSRHREEESIIQIEVHRPVNTPDRLLGQGILSSHRILAVAHVIYLRHNQAVRGHVFLPERTVEYRATHINRQANLIRQGLAVTCQNISIDIHAVGIPNAVLAFTWFRAAHITLGNLHIFKQSIIAERSTSLYVQVRQYLIIQTQLPVEHVAVMPLGEILNHEIRVIVPTVVVTCLTVPLHARHPMVLLQLLYVHVVPHPQKDIIHVVVRLVTITRVIGRQHLIIGEQRIQLHIIHQVITCLESQASGIQLRIGNLSFLVSILQCQIITCPSPFISKSQIRIADNPRAEEVPQIVVRYPVNGHTFITGTVIILRALNITPPRDDFSRHLVTDRAVPLGNLQTGIQFRSPLHITVLHTTTGTVPELILPVQSGTITVLCFRKDTKTGSKHVIGLEINLHAILLCTFCCNQQSAILSPCPIKSRSRRTFQHINTFNVSA